MFLMYIFYLLNDIEIYCSRPSKNLTRLLMKKRIQLFLLIRLFYTCMISKIFGFLFSILLFPLGIGWIFYSFTNNYISTVSTGDYTIKLAAPSQK